METIGQITNKYKEALKNKTEGLLLLERVESLLKLDCSKEQKSLCLKQEIDIIISAYIENKSNDNN